jgi:Tfp pilus assembly protein FimT
LKKISGNNRKSFTLIEVLMAIFIAVILSATVVVNLNVINSKRIEMTGRTITSDLIWARQMAVNNGQDYIVNFTINNTTNGLDGYRIYYNTISAGTLLKYRYVNAVQLVAIRNRTAIDEFTNLSPTILRFKPTGVIKDSNNASINIAGLKMTLGTKNVSVGIFGETGQIVYKDWISPGGEAGCFIATAAYSGVREGAGVPKEVMILKRFRDRYLMPAPLGRACVEVYYELSPLIAHYISARPWLRYMTRALLRPLVWSVKGLVDS